MIMKHFSMKSIYLLVLLFSYPDIPTDIVKEIIKYEERVILSEKKTIDNAMHFASNIMLVDRGLKQYLSF